MLLDKKEITVGIPYYKKTYCDELSKAIESILNQTVMPQEIHLIQDGEVSDDIVRTINNYISLDERFKLFTIHPGQGLPYALNISILNSKTLYYARMDSDDICHYQRLEKQLAFLEENPSVEILGTWLLEFEEDHKSPSERIRQVPTGQEEIYRLFHYRNPLNHPTLMFRKNVFAKIGLYNIHYKKAQDTELYARAFKNNVKVANIPEVLYYMRVNNLVEKRSSYEHIRFQAKARYKYNTWSIKLNILKLASIIFRFFPQRIQQFIYDNYKW